MKMVKLQLDVKITLNNHQKHSYYLKINLPLAIMYGLDLGFGG